MRHSTRSSFFPVLFLALLAGEQAAQAQKTGPAAPRNEDTTRRVAQSTPAGPQAPGRGDIPKQAGPGVRNVPLPKPPFPPLEPVHQKYLDDILTFWEKSSSEIKKYKCEFQRWEYDPVFGPKDTYSTFSTGVIKYATPDKGMFKVDKILHYTPPEAEGKKAKYASRPDEYGDHWVCDGQSVFKFDYPRKQLIESQLPPDMRGKAIADGPLPFLFGAKADKIKERYWIHVVTPSDAKGEYWLEAFPKYRSDAANFKKIEVIIDEADFLPKAIQVFMPGYDEKTNPARSVFMFAKRQKNNHILDPLGIFWQDFSRPAAPKGWEKIVEKYGDESPPPAAPPKSNQASLPKGKPAPK